MIRELKALLPASLPGNFRERLVAHLENLERRKNPASQEKVDLEFRQKAAALLLFYEEVFGVNDLVDLPDEE